MYSSISDCCYHTADSQDEEVMNDWTQQETAIRTEEKQQQLHDELNPKRHLVHQFFRCVKGLVVFCAVNMGVGQLIGIAYEVVDPIQYVMRIYVILLTFLVVMNELEWTKYTKDSTLLNLWITRGLFYAFVGVLGLEENATSPARQNGSDASSNMALSYLSLVAWLMVAAGCLYTCFGAFCLQLLYDKFRREYNQKLDRAKETARTTTLYGDEASLVDGAAPTENVV